MWAYAGENVRAASDVFAKPRPPGTPLAFYGAGAINGLWSCDEDAVAIDGFVKGSCADDMQYLAIARAAEARRPVAAETAIEPSPPRPLIGRDNRPQTVLDPVSRRPVLCLLAEPAVSWEKAEALRRHQRLLRAFFEALLDAMHGQVWSRWTIIGRGA
jgi:hypothetical protein